MRRHRGTAHASQEEPLRPILTRCRLWLAVTLIAAAAALPASSAEILAEGDAEAYVPAGGQTGDYGFSDSVTSGSAGPFVLNSTSVVPVRASAAASSSAEYGLLRASASGDLSLDLSATRFASFDRLSAAQRVIAESGGFGSSDAEFDDVITIQGPSTATMDFLVSLSLSDVISGTNPCRSAAALLTGRVGLDSIRTADAGCAHNGQQMGGPFLISGHGGDRVGIALDLQASEEGGAGCRCTEPFIPPSLNGNFGFWPDQVDLSASVDATALIAIEGLSGARYISDSGTIYPTTVASAVPEPSTLGWVALIAALAPCIRRQRFPRLRA